MKLKNKNVVLLNIMIGYRIKRYSRRQNYTFLYLAKTKSFADAMLFLVSSIKENLFARQIA